MFMRLGIHKAVLFKEDSKETNLVPEEAITVKAWSL